MTCPSLALLNGVANDTTATPAAEPSGHRQFPSMDRAVHRRPGWAASIAMFSKRITYYENGNGENPRGWHTAQGMLQWWGDTYGNGQYTDAFWPTVDPYRLPGTTTASLTGTLSPARQPAWPMTSAPTDAPSRTRAGSSPRRSAAAARDAASGPAGSGLDYGT